VNRREFITLLGGAAAWPLTGQAQQAAMPVIGFLHSASRDPSLSFVAGLKRGLEEEAGLVEGRNVAIEYRWAQGDYERLPALAAELVRHPVSVIIAGGGPRSALAAKAATSTIPVVFTSGSDPVKLGVVESLNRPGGNLTGVVFFNGALVVKRLELLRELVPSATRVGLLANPSNPTEAEPQIRDAREAARVLGVELQVLPASSGQDIEAVFSTLSERRLAGLVMSSDPFLGSRRGQVAVFAARHGMPAVSDIREFASAGGLASYGNSISDVYRQVGVYVARILNGAKSAELPVVQPVKFELVINLNTAKALGLEIPPTLLARADEVIE
jgi:putative tryptophan/tyrosine transport system substrate-binding protein